MELKPGYKQTEVGMVPEEWGVKRLSQLADIRSGGTPSTSRPEYWGGDVLWVTPTDITALDGYKYLSDTTRKITTLGLNVSPAEIIPRNSIVMTSRATIGECAINTVPLSTNQGFKNFVPNDSVDGEFLYYLLTTQKQGFISLCAGSTFLEIGKIQLADYQVCVPKKGEQSAIAALGDVDELLAAQNALLAKQRAIKQGAMQELLTGKRRLPGFGGEWEMRRLGDHLRFLKNGTNSRAELRTEGNIKYLHYGDIHVSSGAFWNVAEHEMPYLPQTKAESLVRLEDGDLVFADASEDLAGVAKSIEICGVNGQQVVPGLHTIAVRFDKLILADGFKAYLQFIPAFYNHLLRLVAGTKVFSTNRAHISGCELALPGIEEQTAIAEVLGEMDAQIAALEAKRQKTALLKQGMMQELLTGRIRLVQPSTTATAIPTEGKNGGRKANVHFMRSVLAAELIDQLHNEPTFGHVKFEKLIFLTEHLCKVDIGSNYHRDAAGPYDNRALRSIDSQLKTQEWFEAKKKGGRYQYVPLEKRGGHKEYFDRYYANIRPRLDEIIATFRTAKTEQCEIVATLYGAWNDLLNQGKPATDDTIVDQVLNHWHDDKKRIEPKRWHKALDWMREKGFVPGDAE